jgi:hypothetical protein
MHTIEVDFDVLKELMARRETEAVTYNDVIRRLLNLDAGRRKGGASPTPTSDVGSWMQKGVRFPAGTEFRAAYKGNTYTGIVQSGRLVVEGKGYESPSAAAVAITGNPVNGWTFWECRRPGDTRWQVLKGLRSAA